MKDIQNNIQDKNNRNLHRNQSDIDTQNRIKRQEHGRRRKAAIRRQKARRRNVCVAIVLILILFIFVITKISSCARNNEERNISTTKVVEKQTKNQIETTKEQETVTYKIKKPKSRKKAKVYKILKQYAEKDSKMAQLYEKRKQYSTNLLNKVINNPEMIDFVLGYNDAENKVTGGLTDKEKEQEYPLFIQWDERWAYATYGDSNIGLAGCGPTCLSMVIFSLTRDDAATPDAIARYSEENGHYVDGVGTAWSLMTEVGEAYGVTTSEIGLSEEEMINELDDGHMLICSVGPGDFTLGGHFIVIYGYDADGFLVNDPYCKARSNRQWSYSRLIGQIRTIWSYSY